MFNLESILKTEYTVKFINVLRQSWQNGYVWSSINNPKKEHLFLLVEDGKVDYTLKNGKKMTANSGDLVYIPAGSEYTSKFTTNKNEVASSVGVNFLLYSEEGEYLENSDIFIFNSQNVKTVIYEIERLSYSFSKIKNKFNAQIYSIFNLISDEFYNLEATNVDFSIIKNGVEYLLKNYNKNFDIAYLASLCSVSEVYFRKLFKKLLGYSPIEYRTKLRIDKACDYLKYTTMLTCEISELLGYIDPAYFIKQFKLARKVTPFRYRNGK